MKTILSLVVLCWSWAAWAQPVLRNSYTTNAPGQISTSLPTLSDVLLPLGRISGSGVLYQSGSFTMIGTNTALEGWLSLSDRTNRLSILNDQLLLDGVAISGGESAPVNNFYTTNQFFVSGKGNTLIITNNIQFPYTTLTFSGTNVSQMNFTNSAFKLTLTTNAFIGTPTGFPGTSLMQTHLLHVQQDGTGSKTLTLTNGSFIMNGSGTSTNAVLTINTNANAYTVISFSSTPFEASKMVGVVSTLGQ